MFYPSRYHFILAMFYLVLLFLLNACNTIQFPHFPPLSTQTARSSVQHSSVYVATTYEETSSDLLALQADTGKILWQRHIAVNTPALLAVNTVIYVVGGLETLTGSRLYAFSSHDGSLLWQTTLKSFGLLWMQSGQGILYLAGPVDGNIYAIRTSDGTLLWQKTLTSTSSFITLVLHNDLLYATSFRDGTLYALHVGNGSLSWKYQSSLSVLSELYLAGSRLYLRAQNKNASQGVLLVLDAARGTLLWQYRPQEGSLTGLTLVGIQIAVASSKGELSLLNVQDGTVVWSANLDMKYPLSTPWISSRQVFIVSNSEHLLYALDQGTGMHLWQKSVSCSAVQNIEQRKDRLYLLGPHDGSLCAIQIQNGTELWHITLISTQKTALFSPLFLASNRLYTVDPDTGILYVLQQGDGALSWQYNLGAFESDLPAPVAFAS